MESEGPQTIAPSVTDPHSPPIQRSTSSALKILVGDARALFWTGPTHLNIKHNTTLTFGYFKVITRYGGEMSDLDGRAIWIELGKRDSAVFLSSPPLVHLTWLNSPWVVKIRLPADRSPQTAFPRNFSGKLRPFRLPSPPPPPKRRTNERNFLNARMTPSSSPSTSYVRHHGGRKRSLPFNFPEEEGRPFSFSPPISNMVAIVTPLSQGHKNVLLQFFCERCAHLSEEIIHNSQWPNANDCARARDPMSASSIFSHG